MLLEGDLQCLPRLEKARSHTCDGLLLLTFYSVPVFSKSLYLSLITNIHQYFVSLLSWLSHIQPLDHKPQASGIWN